MPPQDVAGGAVPSSVRPEASSSACPDDPSSAGPDAPSSAGPEASSSGLPPAPPTAASGPRFPASRPQTPELSYKPFRRSQLLLYDFVQWLFAIIFDCFFREIRPRGAFRIPKSGPVIFVAAPHANQFVDPIVLMNQVRKEAQRRVSFLIATKSYNHPVIGPLSSAQLSIPVSRPQDLLRPGRGTIRVDVAQNPLLVHGRGTSFTQQCMERGLLALPKSLGASEIEAIYSDTKLLLRKPFESSPKVLQLLARGTLFKVADKIDQKQVYHYVFEHLSRGNCLGIFPEGGLHDRTELLPLKAGVAIMALGAMSHDPLCKVKIVPCGMNYFNAHKFRSRAVVEFGPPIEVSAEMVARYDDPQSLRDAIKDLLDLVTNGLRAVTVNCHDYETLMVVQAARRLYAGHFAQYLPLPMVVEMNRRLLLGYETFRDHPDMVLIKNKILHYNKVLQNMHLPDHHVEECDETHKLNLLPVFMGRVFKLLVFAVLALPGLVLFSPVFALAHRVSAQKKKTALANSTVKIKANDVVATWKILISMGFAPLLYLFYASICTWYCKKHNYLSSYGLFSMWCIIYFLGILVTYLALVTGEQGMDLFKSLRPLYLSIFLGSSITELKQLRMDLSNDITEFVNKYGLELFPDDFNLLEVASHDHPPQHPKLVDSDEEEELKTQQLRHRRRARKGPKMFIAGDTSESSKNSDTDMPDDASSSTSDGLSIDATSKSYTNIPVFSDYALHMNAKNPLVELHSAMPSQMSISDDFNYRGTASPSAISRNSSHVEINFGKKPSSLSDKIKTKIRESRDRKLAKD